MKKKGAALTDPVIWMILAVATILFYILFNGPLKEKMMDAVRLLTG